MRRLFHQWIERVAAGYLGEAFERLRMHCHEVYPHDHWYGFWRDLLTGRRRVVFAMGREVQPDGKVKVIDTDYFETEPVMTRDEWHKTYPFHVEKPKDDEPEGQAEMFDRVMSAIRTPPPKLAAESPDCTCTASRTTR